MTQETWGKVALFKEGDILPQPAAFWKLLQHFPLIRVHHYLTTQQLGRYHPSLRMQMRSDDERSPWFFFEKCVTGKKRVQETFRLLRQKIIKKAVFEACGYDRHLLLTGKAADSLSIAVNDRAMIVFLHVRLGGRTSWVGIFKGFFPDKKHEEQVTGATLFETLLKAKEVLKEFIEQIPVWKAPCQTLIDDIDFIYAGDMQKKWPTLTLILER